MGGWSVDKLEIDRRIKWWGVGGKAMLLRSCLRVVCGERAGGWGV